ncbi:hypothetical protein BJV82DRAFT_584932 [Fennellomyces sp. T-0311]|nr:hypothetical protein BJV82DRAFT_584932 [Fennellomyces sp. T-0311]
MNRINFVKETIGGRREVNEQEDLPTDHPVWNHLNNRHYVALNALIENPFTFDPAAFPREFRQAELPEDAEVPGPQNVIYYVRVCRLQKQLLRRHLDLYIEQYPADMDWANNMRVHLLQLENVVADYQDVSLLYFGMTLANTAEGRLRDDLGFLAHTRFNNWNRCTGNRCHWVVYTIAQIAIVSPSVEALVEHPVAGLMEDIWITACGNLSLNSAHGGYNIDWRPSPATVQLWQDFGIQVVPAVGGDNAPSPALRRSIAVHFHDYHRFMLNSVPNIRGPMPSVEFVDVVIRTATPGRVTPNGRTVSLIMGKDVTAQNIRSNLGFWDDNAGTAPLFLRQLFRTFHRTALPTFVNLFPLTTLKSMQIGIPFATRYLRIVKPLIVLATSSLVYTAFQYDFFADTWEHATLQAYDQFLLRFQSPDTVEELSQLVDATYPSTFAKSGFANRIGQVINIGIDL